MYCLPTVVLLSVALIVSYLILKCLNLNKYAKAAVFIAISYTLRVVFFLIAVDLLFVMGTFMP